MTVLFMKMLLIYDGSHSWDAMSSEATYCGDLSGGGGDCHICPFSPGSAEYRWVCEPKCR